MSKSLSIYENCELWEMHLKNISGEGLTFGPPQYLYHGYALDVMYEIMSVCMCVKQQTDDLYIIMYNCIYSVVINCG